MSVLAEAAAKATPKACLTKERVFVFMSLSRMKEAGQLRTSQKRANWAGQALAHLRGLMRKTQ
jgi:hypothetical protein